MIHVIAIFQTKPGKRAAFLDIFRAVIPLVRNESGCIEYFSAIDFASDLSLQHRDENIVIVIEKWSNIDALRAHASSTHMLEFVKNVHDLIVDAKVKILQEV